MSLVSLALFILHLHAAVASALNDQYKYNANTNAREYYNKVDNNLQVT